MTSSGDTDDVEAIFNEHLDKYPHMMESIRELRALWTTNM